MKLKISNLRKPSNLYYKRIADVFLYTLPLYQGAIMASPLTEKQKLWYGFILTMIIVTLKGLTKFTSQEDQPK